MSTLTLIQRGERRKNRDGRKLRGGERELIDLSLPPHRTRVRKMNSYDPPQPDSPPPAHPASQQPSLSSWPPPPRPPRQSSSRRNATETLYWGSAAPASLNSRRSAPRKGTSYHPSTTSPPPQVPRGTFSPVLLTEGTCCCCATRVKYPRASGTFRCVTCDTVVDLNEEQRRGKSSEGAFSRPSLLSCILVLIFLPSSYSRTPT